jgi:hypothetical protein
LASREQLLQHLPEGGVGAEIGVAEGNFSAAILEAAAPTELHLIDPWSHLEAGSDLLGANTLLAQVGEAGGHGAAVPRNLAGDRLYGSVEQRFAADPRVRLHRQYSYRAAAGFEDGLFDFVYIDGNHHYEFVLRDLEDYAAKLKPGGLLFGHDFFENDFAREHRYGVMDAVRTFVKRTDFVLLMLTWEPYSTFFLARRMDGFAGRMMHNVFSSDIGMIELPDELAASYQDKMYERPDGTAKRIPSFVNALHFQLS